MPPLRFARVETFLGATWVAETDTGVAAVSRADSPEAFRAALSRRFPDRDPVPAELDTAWLDGRSLPRIDVRGLSAFDARVYAVVRGIPPGETLTYGEVARLVGSPGAARAVGGAVVDDHRNFPGADH